MCLEYAVSKFDGFAISHAEVLEYAEWLGIDLVSERVTRRFSTAGACVVQPSQMFPTEFGLCRSFFGYHEKGCWRSYHLIGNLGVICFPPWPFSCISHLTNLLRNRFSLLCSQNEEGQLYYFNFDTGDSVWEHPCDTLAKCAFNS
jgi:hypothetical protein